MVAPTDRFMHGLENIKIKEWKDYMIDEVRTKRVFNYQILRVESRKPATKKLKHSDNKWRLIS